MNTHLFRLAYAIATFSRVSTSVLAQFPSDRFRDVNAAGPYPIYIVIQPGTFGWGHNDYSNFSCLYGEKHNSTYHKNLWGGETGFGFVVYEGKLTNIYFEPFCYRYLTRKQTNSDETERMKYAYQTASFRVGFRKNIFYPVTLHITGGIIYYYQQAVRTDSSFGNNNFKIIQYTDISGLFVNKNFHKYSHSIPGYDLKVRFNIIDAISSSGGLGIYFELYGSIIRKQPIPLQVFGLDQSPTNNQPTTNMETWEINKSISFGVVIPLALRVKRLFPKNFKPKQYRFSE